MIAEAAGRRAKGMEHGAWGGARGRRRGVRSMTISVISVTSVFCKVREGCGGMIAEAVGVLPFPERSRRVVRGEVQMERGPRWVS